MQLQTVQDDNYDSDKKTEESGLETKNMRYNKTIGGGGIKTRLNKESGTAEKQSRRKAEAKEREKR